MTRDVEIKNKLTVTRGVWGEDNGGQKGKGHQGTCIKDSWTKPKQGRIEGGTGTSGDGKMETTVLEQQFKKKKFTRVLRSLCQKLRADTHTHTLSISIISGCGLHGTYICQNSWNCKIKVYIFHCAVNYAKIKKKV